MPLHAHGPSEAATLAASPETFVPVALTAVIAGALSLAFGAAPLGVLLISRRMSLMGDALAHAILPGAAFAFLLVGPDPWALTFGALLAGLLVASASGLMARGSLLPEDASFAVLYLSAMALAVLIFGQHQNAETLHSLLFGDLKALDTPGLIFSALAASATVLALAVFLRGFVAASADPVFVRGQGGPEALLHLLLMCLVAINLVAGFRAFGALMTVGLMMIPAAAARFWARHFFSQVGAAVLISALASGVGLWLASVLNAEPGAVMVLSAAVLFVASAVLGSQGGLIRRLPLGGHLEG